MADFQHAPDGVILSLADVINLVRLYYSEENTSQWMHPINEHEFMDTLLREMTDPRQQFHVGGLPFSVEILQSWGLSDDAAWRIYHRIHQKALDAITPFVEDFRAGYHYYWCNQHDIWITSPAKV